jgi:hypothetical protein
MILIYRSVVIVLLLNAVSVSDSKDLGKENNFDFLTFENFVLTKEIFLSEQKLVSEINKLRSILDFNQNLIQRNLNNSLYYIVDRKNLSLQVQ